MSIQFASFKGCCEENTESFFIAFLSLLKNCLQYEQTNNSLILCCLDNTDKLQLIKIVTVIQSVWGKVSKL